MLNIKNTVNSQLYVYQITEGQFMTSLQRPLQLCAVKKKQQNFFSLGLEKKELHFVSVSLEEN